MVEKIVLTTALYNKTIEESCSSKSLAVPAIDFESVERLKAFLTKHATHQKYFFSFWLTNSTKHFYQFNSRNSKIHEKNGTIVTKSIVCCIKQGYSVLQKIGISLGTVFTFVIFICTIKFIVFHRNKIVSLYLLNIYLIKLDIEKINI